MIRTVDMKKRYISIDGGTTNTRVTLVENNIVLGTLKGNVGARKSIDGNTELCEFIQNAIRVLLKEHWLCESDIIGILASGMISSEFGLYQLPHICAPAGIKELHNSIKQTYIPEICPLPFYFIPGVNLVGDRLEDCDMMRGEETELYGLDEGSIANSVCVLPGSHSKLIVTDAEGRIERFFTMLSGEMIAALSQNTILKDAVDLSVNAIDEAALIEGYNYAIANGVNEALFKVRVGKNLLGRTKEQTYSFFIGTVLSGEVRKLVTLECERIILGGKSQLKQATAVLLNALGGKNVTVADDLAVDNSTVLGQIKVFEYMD